MVKCLKLTERIQPDLQETRSPIQSSLRKIFSKEETRRESRVCNLSTQQPFELNEIIHKLIEGCSTLTKIEWSFASNLPPVVTRGRIKF